MAAALALAAVAIPASPCHLDQLLEPVAAAVVSRPPASCPTAADTARQSQTLIPAHFRGRAVHGGR